MNKKKRIQELERENELLEDEVRDLKKLRQVELKIDYQVNGETEEQLIAVPLRLLNIEYYLLIQANLNMRSVQSQYNCTTYLTKLNKLELVKVFDKGALKEYFEDKKRVQTQNNLNQYNYLFKNKRR